MEPRTPQTKPRPNTLRDRWATWRNTQIRDRGDIASHLRDITPAQIRDDIHSIFPTNSTISDAEWDKAILVAKAGPHRLAFQAPPGPSLHLHHHRPGHGAGSLQLTTDELDSLRAEREKLSSQRGILAIIVTVALAAFLQGHVQSSINAGSLYADTLGIPPANTQGGGGGSSYARDGMLGIMNASPFFSAALLGAPLSLPANYYIGRRGALVVSAMLIIVSSLGSSFSRTWVQLLCVRIVGGVGMGIKAISAPILASESASGFWRGSIMLTWQLWVACGIMIGFVVNIVIAEITGSLDAPFEVENPSQQTLDQQYLTLQWILGAPLVPAVLLFVSVLFCYESPRFYMRENSPNFDPRKALDILFAIRKTRLQALRDLILIRWSTKLEESAELEPGLQQRGLTYASQLWVVLKLSWHQYRTLLETRRLRNAVWSTCTVALSQQLCGINVFAFYSNSVFIDYDDPSGIQLAMLYSFGFGAVNFFFGLGAMRTIDTAGRRAWLMLTLPMMCIFLFAAALAFPAEDDISSPRTAVGIFFVFLFVAAYSPGLGPIPFTLASESFPLSHREAGASVAIAINLFFAGVLTIALPAMRTDFTTPGTLGFFSAMNVVAFALVFLIVEETKRLSLEELDLVYNRPKREFVRYQLREMVPYVVRRYVLFQRSAEKPPPYDQYIAMQEEEDGYAISMAS